MNKEEQKQHLIDLMRLDEEAGLYHTGDTNKMVTAVEWLFDTLSNKGYFIGSNGYFKAFKEANAMDKEQKIDAHIEGQRVFDKHEHTQWTIDKAEQYYNETYGQGSNNYTFNNK